MDKSYMTPEIREIDVKDIDVVTACGKSTPASCHCAMSGAKVSK